MVVMYLLCSTNFVLSCWHFLLLMRQTQRERRWQSFGGDWLDGHEVPIGFHKDPAFLQLQVIPSTHHPSSALPVSGQRRCPNIAFTTTWIPLADPPMLATPLILSTLLVTPPPCLVAPPVIMCGSRKLSITDRISWPGYPHWIRRYGTRAFDRTGSRM